MKMSVIMTVIVISVACRAADPKPFYKSDFSKQCDLKLFSKGVKKFNMEALKVVDVDNSKVALAQVSIPKEEKLSYFYFQIPIEKGLPLRDPMFIRLKVKNMEGGGCVGVIATQGKKQNWAYFLRPGDLGKEKWRTIKLNIFPGLKKACDKNKVDPLKTKLTKVWFRFVGKRKIKFYIKSLEVDYLKNNPKAFCKSNTFLYNHIIKKMNKKTGITKEMRKIKSKIISLGKQLQYDSPISLARGVAIRIELDELSEMYNNASTDQSMEALLK